MQIEELKKDIYYVGSAHSERRLFDELIPLPDGTSYNAYLVKGSEKVALIDTVDPVKEKDLIEKLKKLQVERLDYIVSQHCEQDHSGAIPTILKLYPEAKVITNAKCKELLIDHLLIAEEKFLVVEDRQTISLGNKTLEFVLTPWVHWPETMSTYIKEDKILFSCDFFGSHIGIGDIHVKDKDYVYKAAKRYYAEIMMPFRVAIKSNLKKLADYDIEMIAPSHGPVYDQPDFIISAYKDWISDSLKNEVVVPYVSMHGSTAEMVDYFVEALQKQGITVKAFNLAKADLGELAMALVDAATIVIGSPTVLVGAHPAAIHIAAVANALRPKAKFVSVIGSYGWGGKMVDQLKGLIPGLRVELLAPVVAKGFPKEEDYKKLDSLVETIKQKHQSLNKLGTKEE